MYNVESGETNGKSKKGKKDVPKNKGAGHWTMTSSPASGAPAPRGKQKQAPGAPQIAMSHPDEEEMDENSYYAPPQNTYNTSQNDSDPEIPMLNPRGTL